MIAGIGRVEGREVMILANDATVKGGTYYPMSVKKHLRAQEIAEENNGCRASIWWTAAAPTCPTRTRCFPTAIISAGSSSTRPTCRQGHRPDRGRHGLVHGGGAYVPAMSDETIIVKRTGHDLPGRPAAGESGDRRGGLGEDLGGGDVHTRLSGVADHLARDDPMRWPRPPRVANLNRPRPGPDVAWPSRKTRSTTRTKSWADRPGDLKTPTTSAR
jgi:3-methylcrotonyl-CoA carboxylase beta subunit